MGEVIFTQVNDENETTSYEKEIVAILLPELVLNFRYSLLVLRYKIALSNSEASKRVQNFLKCIYYEHKGQMGFDDSKNR